MEMDMEEMETTSESEVGRGERRGLASVAVAGPKILAVNIDDEN